MPDKIQTSVTPDHAQQKVFPFTQRADMNASKHILPEHTGQTRENDGCRFSGRRMPTNIEINYFLLF